MQTLEQFKQVFKGNVILPADAAYDEASKVLARKGHPALIAEAQSPEDVALAIAYAREHSLTISVRSGGHSNAGLSTNDGGIIIDVGKLNEIKLLDKTTGRVRLGAGVRWGDAAKVLDADGLGISSGDTASVGVAGLTLGAGMGWMVRKFGLALDHLQSVELVTAEGAIVTASVESNPELFWALRGGGGNFGIATAFEFTAHPAGDVYFGAIMYDTDDVASLLRGWRDTMRTAPEELTTMAVLVPAKAMGANPQMCLIQCCWDGDDKTALSAALAPLKALGKVTNDTIAKKRYFEVLEEAHPPAGVHIEVNNAFFDDFSDEVIEKIVASYKQGHIFQLRSAGGAMNRAAPDATAFAHRNSEMLVVAPQFFPETTPEADIQEGLQAWHDIAALGNGAYINFFSRATEREVAAAYPAATYARLVAVKNEYDPHNIFNQNLNIKPHAGD